MNWELIYRQHSSSVLQYLKSLTFKSGDAEDLLQETFIKAMRSEASLRDESKVYSWLLTIARNLFFDSRRKLSRRETMSIDDENFQDIEARPETQGNPERYAVQSDFETRLEMEISNLPETLKTAFVLGIMQKLTYKEIGDITEWSPSMVKTNVFRARKKIALALSEFK